MSKRLSIIFAAAVWWLSHLINADSPVPVPWQNQFSVSFLSNITTTDDSTSAIPIKNTMYYDWDLEMQRVDHGGGSYECVRFYNSNFPCTIWFTPQGLYRQLSEPLPEGQPECCLDMPDIKTTPPNWATSTDPLPTYLVTDKEKFSGMLSHLWSFITGEPNPSRAPHEYRQVGDESDLHGRPLLFTFPVDDGRQDYHFDPSSLIVGKPDSSLFDLPSSCKENDGPRMCPQQ